MARVSVLIDPTRTLGAIDPQIYGHFVEHIGRAIYGGIYEPGHPSADEQGFRTDVIDLVAQLKPAVLRWPGGNFASGYHWRDGIGPRQSRPLRKDLAWGNLEDNSFGTDEFIAYCRRIDAAPYLNLNMGTGTVDEAVEWVDYCNGREATPDARLRGGDPHDVKIWGLGNEVYGFWQHGHTEATTYAEMAREWAKLLKWQDASIQVIGVGAPTADWNWTVLKNAGRVLDYMSLHYYWRENPADPFGSILAGPLRSEEHLVAQWGLSVAAATEMQLRRPVRLAIDEWNVWTHTPVQVAPDRGRLDPFHNLGGFEEAYNLRDALAVAIFMNVMWRHPEKIGLATLAQMVNVIAPIHTDDKTAFAHTIFHPLVAGRRAAGPVALDVIVDGDGLATPGTMAGSTPVVDTAATWDPESGRIHLSMVNRSPGQEAIVTFDLPAGHRKAELETLHHDDVNAGNDSSVPDRVRPVTSAVELGRELALPPHSHTTLVTTF